MRLKNVNAGNSLTMAELYSNIDNIWPRVTHAYTDVPAVVKVGNEYRTVSGFGMKVLADGTKAYVISTHSKRRRV